MIFMRQFITSVVMSSSLVQPINASRGAFILFEGLDRCGKSTQCQLSLKNSAAIRPTSLIRFPDRTSSIGQLINSYLQSGNNLNDQTIHLLFSANRWESAPEIEQKLLSGTTLVCNLFPSLLP